MKEITMDLYLDRLPELESSFRKEAGFAARLSESPENWPQELTSELHRQLPYLSDYEVMVNLQRVEPQRGFAFGFADVTNRTERPEVEHEEAGIPHVRIPLVVIERAVKPFTVFLDGERVLPLNEDRLRELLFNPQTFDLSNSEPRDPSMIEQLMPPIRSGMGMGGETKMASAPVTAPGSMHESTWLSRFEGTPLMSRAIELEQSLLDLDKDDMKRRAKDQKHWLRRDEVYMQKRALELELAKSNGTKTASLLTAIAPTIREKDVSEFTEKVASDATLIAGFRRSGIAPTLVDVFEKTARVSSEERLEALAESILPTVVTIQKLPGGDFLFKSANVNAFNPKSAKGQVVPEEEAAEAMGPETAQAMQPGQTATAVAEPTEPKPLIETNEKIVEEFGEWLVQDVMGNRLLGWVFPKVLAWDGNFTPQDIALFTNGSAYAFQDTVAGEMAGKGTTLPMDAPRGDGVFYSVERGQAICTAPITIGSSAAGPDGQSKFQGTDVFGNQVQVSLQEGIKLPMRVTDVEYALPASWKFMRLNNQTELVSDPVQMNKVAHYAQAKSSVTLFFNGSYNFDGGCGLDKLASGFYEDIDPVQAEFILGLLGVDGVAAKQKVAEARRKGSVKLAGLKTVTLLAERYQESVKTASALLKQVPDLRRDLTKEAAAIPDAGSADSLLALNFINPENLATFVGYVPELEQTSERLAEMLLNAYLGQSEVPEGALERGMKNLEEVILSLKSLQQTQA